MLHYLLLAMIFSFFSFANIPPHNTKQSPTSIADKNGNTMNIVYNAYNSPSSFTTASELGKNMSI